jgi:protein-tyrosine sulfotransferase
MTVQEPAELDTSPVFVLTSGRAGSTLLRFILDSHPELACPPETAVAAACYHVAYTRSVLDKAIARRSGGKIEPISAAALVAARGMADAAFADYLEETGKQRWCEKSLETLWHVDLMAQIYPKAKFICLYRHCMDVVASFLDSLPWGLANTGMNPGLAQVFNDFVVRHPGDSVSALADFWLGCSRRTAAFEEEHPERCFRLRYEDLVAAPEETMAGVFSFLGVKQVPGLTEACFRTEHDSGPSDSKIWFTSRVEKRSVGRGRLVPGRRLEPSVRTGVNEVLSKLGYRLVTKEWNDVGSPVDPRVDAAAGAADGVVSEPNGASSGQELDTVVAVLGKRVRSRSVAELGRLREFCPAVSGAVLALVVEGGAGTRRELEWSFAAALQAAGGDGPSGDGSGGRLEVSLTAGPGTWQSLLAGETNPSIEAMAGRLRARPGPGNTARLDLRGQRAIAALLGLTEIP